MNRLRLLDLGGVGGLRSQAVYHALCHSVSEGMPATLVVLYPVEPYACIGYHRHLDAEVDRAFCQARGIAVYRRRVGGGAVYLDPDQVFFQLVVPANRVRGSIAQVYAELLGPAVAAYRALGVRGAALSGVNDIAVQGRKLSGTGMARIADAVVLVGNVILDVDHHTMARVLKLPDEFARAWIEASMRRWVSSIQRETRDRPTYEAVAEALRWAYGDWAGSEPEPGSLSAAEEAHVARAADRLGSAAWLDGDGQVAGHPTPTPRRIKIRAGRYDGIFDASLAQAEVRGYLSSVDGMVEAAHFRGEPSDQKGSRVGSALRDLGLALVGHQPATPAALACLVERHLRSIPGVRREQLDTFTERLAAATRTDE